MLSDELVKIIEQRANDLAYNWYKDITSSNYVPNIVNLTRDEALEMALKILRRLNQWLGGDKDIEGMFTGFGEQCYFKGFNMEEVVMLLTLLKRHIWLHLLEAGIMTTNIEVLQALDVNNKVVLYFDRAIYFSLVGFKQGRDAEKTANGKK